MRRVRLSAAPFPAAILGTPGPPKWTQTFQSTTMPLNPSMIQLSHPDQPRFASRHCLHETRPAARTTTQRNDERVLARSQIVLDISVPKERQTFVNGGLRVAFKAQTATRQFPKRLANPGAHGALSQRQGRLLRERIRRTCCHLWLFKMLASEPANSQPRLRSECVWMSTSSPAGQSRIP